MEGDNSFEKWIHVKAKDKVWFDGWCTGFRKMMKQEDPTGVGMFTRFVCGISEREEQLEGIEAYGLIYQEVAKAYQALEADHEGLAAEWDRITHIARTMWDLDDGLEVLVGEPIEPIEHGLEEGEDLRRLAVLDRGRAIFGATLIKAFTQLTLFSDRNLLISWAAKLYYHVHGFQAPHRMNPQQALQDSLGKSDHFAELLEEVIAKVPEAKLK